MSVARVLAPAKLTVSLRVVGRRPDGYHLLDAEMVSVDLCDVLEIGEIATDRASTLEIVDRVVGGAGTGNVPLDGANLVLRALDAAGRRASVRLVKRIPPGAGLGGGSADAAAVLRWAGCLHPSVAVSLGADVPFCVVGGRARVRGIGELVEPLPATARRYLVLVPPVSVSTPAAYAAYDELRRDAPSGTRPTWGPQVLVNDLEPAALWVEPALARWRDAFAAAVGMRPSLAGSGSAWFVDVTSVGDGRSGGDTSAPTSVEMDGRSAPILALRSLVPEVGVTNAYQV